MLIPVVIVAGAIVIGAVAYVLVGILADALRAARRRGDQTPRTPAIEVVCPECGAAYRSGVSECADCRVALVRRPVETIPGPRESHPEPIIVFESDEPEAVAMARSMLGSAGIPFVTTGGNPWRGVSDPPGARVQFLVRADDAEAAKAVLDVLQSGE